MALMQVSRRVDYALRAAIHLARQKPEQPTSVSEISQVEGIPKKFLEKILQDLIQDGVVVSRRGARGGYLLARSPAEVSFREVMEAVEGPIALNVCVGEKDQCSVSSSCSMRRIWAEGQRRLDDLFSSTKLIDLVIPPALAQVSDRSSVKL